MTSPFVNSRFAVNPTNVNISRSAFKRDQDILTTFNFGKLVPFYIEEVLPGSTISIDTSVLARLSTPIHPTMGNAFLDIYYFSVPNRLLWTHFTDFMGENNSGPWAPTTEYQIPQTVSPDDGYQKGSVADYLGVPTLVGGISVNSLPFRAYTLVWNQYFRSEAINDFAYLPLDDSTIESQEFLGGTPNQTAFAGLDLLPVAKFFDYFSSALPQPQRGEASSLPISFPEINITADGPLSLRQVNGTNYYDQDINLVQRTSSSDAALSGYVRSGTVNYLTKSGTTETNFVNNTPLAYNSGLVASPDGSGAQISINELRLAFQLQKLLERDARGGGRYTSILLSHFGVQSPDARLQRAEYLGGKRIPIQINQVLQTSATNEVSPQGNTAAYSLTTDYSSSFTKSFVEHGYIIGVCCLRYEHTYQQGLEKMWLRKGRYDFYWPVLANIGEQPIKNAEIFVQGTDEDDETFGFNEAWAEYRYKPNRVSGAFRSNYAQSLDVWHYGDFYSSLPTLSPEWLAEDPTNVDRTLAVSSELEDQCIANIYVKNKSVLPMPTYSIPGLIDHN